MPTGNTRTHQSGAAYLLLLLLLTTLAMAAVHGLRLGEAFQRQEAEQALVRVGMAYEQALLSYTRHGGTAPQTLDDLLLDARTPGVTRHLRRLWPDPVSGRPWGLMRDPHGRIVAVFSQADGRPVRQTGWGPAHARFENARSYADWTFGMPPGATSVTQPR